MEVNGVATIRDSRFVGNSVTANAPAGFAGAGGGAISNFGQTTIERTLVTANTVTVTAGQASRTAAESQNDTLFGSTPNLTLTDTVIAGNTLSANTGLRPKAADSSQRSPSP